MQLIIHVQDTVGNLLSNSPSVLLQVISEPGEFPTGRSILFESNKDIRIMDGQAAIAFRSYHTGKTIIQATSPGLKPARIELRFIGAPTYQPQTTPETHRPYTPYTYKKPQASVLQTFGRNNPTFASSQQVGQSAGLAADGNQSTYWQATTGDDLPWWMLDTEKGSAPEQEVDISFKTDEHPVFARYIRIRFMKKSPATVAEMKVSGIVQ